MRRATPWVVINALNKTAVSATGAAASASDFVNIQESYQRANIQGKVTLTTAEMPNAFVYDKLKARLTQPTGITNITAVTVDLLGKINADDDIIKLGTFTYGVTAQSFSGEVEFDANYVQLFPRVAAFAAGLTPTISFKLAVAGFYQEN